MFNLFNKHDLSFIVYQMGKVGSSTILHGLEKTYGKKRVLHTHNHEKAREHLEEWSRSFDEVIVITGFREPLSRCISAYFQNLTRKQTHWFVGRRKEVLEKSIDWMINDYNAKVVPHVRHVVGPWLENYERAVNCKLAEFTRAEGCWKASLKNVHLYIYKLEAFKEFHQGMADDRFLKKVGLVNSNMSAEKWYDGIYREFKKEFRISRNRYDALYGNIDFVRRLYDEHEIRNLTKNFVPD